MGQSPSRRKGRQARGRAECAPVWVKNKPTRPVCAHTLTHAQGAPGGGADRPAAGESRPEEEGEADPRALDMCLQTDFKGI